MREDYWSATFWLVVVSSWVMGMAYGRWVGNGFFIDLSQAVRVPSPTHLTDWWQPIAYFTLTVIATFVLAQLFFGVGSAVFLFSRGVHDSLLIAEVDRMVRGWSIQNIPAEEFMGTMFIVLILAVNLPICLWAAHLGLTRALRMFCRLRGKPLKPEAQKQMATLLILLTASIVTGLVGSLILAYMG